MERLLRTVTLTRRLLSGSAAMVIDTSRRPFSALVVDGVLTDDLTGLYAAIEAHVPSREASSVTLPTCGALFAAYEDAALVVMRPGLCEWLTRDRQVVEDLAMVAFADRQAHTSDGTVPLYRSVAEHLPDAAILMFDHNLHYVLAEGPALFATVGLSKADVLGRVVGLSSSNPAQIQALCRMALAGESQSFRMTRDERSFAITVAPVRNASAEVTHGLLFAFDETERVIKEREAATKVQRDDLTGLLNRGGFLAGLRDRAKREHGTILFVDVDGLKRVNDLSGHAAGDEVIVGCAAVLRHALREHDLIGRLGGDEFAAFVSGESDAAGLVRRVRQAAATHSVMVAHSTGVSVGHAPCSPADDVEARLASADRVMYEDKRSRKAARQD